MKKLLKNKWTYILLSLLTTAILCLSLGLNFVGGGRTDLTLTTNTTSADGPTNTGYWTDTATQTALNVDFTNYTLGGSGTAESPYQINSETDLAFLSWTIYNNKAYNGNVTSSRYFYSDKYFKQTKNLDMSAYYWQPIGTYYLRTGTTARRYFSGNYDGGGFTISGLYTPAGSNNAYSYQGLFGYVWTYNTVAVSITNIGVIDSFIQGNSYVGGVVGIAGSNSTITNCYNTGTVTGSDSSAGGVVGYAHNDSTIDNCYNTGAVTGNSSVGGVVGYAYYSTITNCYNTGSVTSTSTDIDSEVGGVVGYASSSTITNCYNTGSVTGRGGCVGGVVGFAYNYSTITNCYNTGTVTGNSYVGGVAGYAYYSTITNCYNTGSVTGGGDRVGGVVGSASNSTISNTYYGGECTLPKGIGSGSGTATKIDAPVKEWAKNKAWYTDSSKWNSSYPWDFDTVWMIVDNHYPTLQPLTWISSVAQTALGVDFKNYSLSGSGTAKSPYKISSETDLAFLSWTIYNNKAYNGNVTSGNYFYSGKFFKQTKNLDMSAYYWQPIGIYYLRTGTSVRRYFSGNYDGGGHTVSGLHTPSVPDGLTTTQQRGYSYQGLFGYVRCYRSTQEVTISNVGVIDSFIQGYSSVGGVVGLAYSDSTIENCYNTGTVTGRDFDVGGVVGSAGSSSTITNCYNTGSVEGSGVQVGGVVGYAYSNSTITNCYNTGTVTGNKSVGGVVGHTYANSSSSPVTITNCGVETTQISGNSNVGMLVGYGDSSTTITNCYGIVGGDIYFASVGTYDNCVWITNVDGAVNKYYHGTNFSAFAWFNPNSCPIPKSLSSLGQFWTENITRALTTSSEWQEVA